MSTLGEIAERYRLAGFPGQGENQLSIEWDRLVQFMRTLDEPNKLDSMGSMVALFLMMPPVRVAVLLAYAVQVEVDRLADSD